MTNTDGHLHEWDQHRHIDWFWGVGHDCEVCTICGAFRCETESHRVPHE